jgi:hypothetical protein
MFVMTFFLIFRTPKVSLRTPGVRVSQVEYHCTTVCSPKHWYQPSGLHRGVKSRRPYVLFAFVIWNLLKIHLEDE